MAGAADEAPLCSACGSNTVSVVVGGSLPRDLARTFARRDGQIHLLGVCKHSADILRVTESRGPDVLLLAGPIIQAGLVKLLRQFHPGSSTRTLLLTNCRDIDFIETALRHGVKGCVRTGSGGHNVVKAIVAVKRGEVWLERRLLAEVLGELVADSNPVSSSASQPLRADLPNRMSLTNRENEILPLLARGLTNKEIAKTLNVSTETIKMHLKNIFTKLGVHRRTQVLRSHPSSA